MLGKKDLVVLKGIDDFMIGHTEFNVGQHYRASILGKNDIVVYGEPFSSADFDNMFEFYQDKVIRDWKRVGLIKENGKPITRKRFRDLLIINKYNNSKHSMRIFSLYVNGREKYAFYPLSGTLEMNYKEMYQWYLDILSGDVSSLDNDEILFGNTPLPPQYGKIHFLKIN